MSAAERFLDTNILLYLISSDGPKADRAERLLAEGGVISVQVLNEFAAVASRKSKLGWPAIRAALDTIRATVDVLPLTIETHERALEIAQRSKLNIYDACIVAAAAEAGCKQIVTEDLQHDQRIAGTTVFNPFR